MRHWPVKAAILLLFCTIALPPIYPQVSRAQAMTGAQRTQAFTQAQSGTLHGAAALDASQWSWLFPGLQSAQDHHVEVFAGGQSIGIKLHASGILVVGYHLVHEGKQAFSPGERSNIHVGDVIDTVEGRHVTSVEQVSRLIAEAGAKAKPLRFGFHRKGRVLATSIVPQLDDDTGSYRIGLYIRDSASGVGTLTFYVPANHGFGALGHVIADVDTGDPIEGHGQIVHAAVTSIDRGESGQPGEKRGLFVNERKVLGTIIRNSEFGVFGFMQNPPDHGFFTHPVQVALPAEVHPGPAKILTVVSGQKVEAFDVLIVRATRQDSADTKGLIIRITDHRLLSKTGGIVQGMSGSPIIQDGRLAGAVTHVFVSDPTQGYGVYAEWMLRNLGLNSKQLGKIGFLSAS
ncbi:MAG: SpoIVB peptidase [Bacilli bacterium]